VLMVVSSYLRLVCTFINDGASDFFVVGVIAATVTRPTDEVLKPSAQVHRYLFPGRINGHKIIKSSLQWVRTLIDDTDGHGRALEVLKETLHVYQVTKTDERLFDKAFHENFSGSYREQLLRSYPAWDKVTNDRWVPLFESAIARKPFHSLGEEVCNGYTVEAAMNLGLVRWTTGKPLEVPFVLCLLVSQLLARDPCPVSTQLRNLLCEGHSGLMTRDGTGAWRDWESFIAEFLCLKAKVFNGRTLSLSELHYGAKLSPRAQESMVEVEEQVVEKVSTRYLCGAQLRQEVPIPYDSIVINGLGASGPDIFSTRCLRNGKRKKLINEVIACRLRKDGKLSSKDYNTERGLAKQKRKDDFFMMFVRNESTPGLILGPERDGLVDASCFSDYFGPCVGRAFS